MLQKGERSRRPSIPTAEPRAFTGDHGRSRWLPDGRHLAGFEPGLVAESFDIAPDGSWLVLSSQQHTATVMLAENVPGVRPPPR